MEAGWLVNWLGVRTRASFASEMEGAAERTRVTTELPPPSDTSFEWLDLLEAVCAADGSFTMVELGAGFGRWLVNGAVALDQVLPGTPFHLVGVEAEPTHFGWLQEHLRDNGIDPAAHTLVHAAVAGKPGRVRFQLGDAAGWYGQAIERDDPAAKLAGPVSRLIRWGRNTAANRIGRGPRKVRRVRATTVEALLRPLELVDLIHVDVQAAEADALEPAAEVLARKVKRVHVGTHDADNERRLRILFERLGWESRADYEHGRVNETPWGPIEFEDGVQSWVNPALAYPSAAAVSSLTGPFPSAT